MVRRIVRTLVVAGASGMVFVNPAVAQQVQQKATKAAPAAPKPAETPAPAGAAAPADANAQSQPVWTSRCASDGRQAALFCEVEQSLYMTKTGTAGGFRQCEVAARDTTARHDDPASGRIISPGWGQLADRRGQAATAGDLDLRSQGMLCRDDAFAGVAGIDEVRKASRGRVPEFEQGKRDASLCAFGVCRGISTKSTDQGARRTRRIGVSGGIGLRHDAGIICGSARCSCK